MTTDILSIKHIYAWLNKMPIVGGLRNESSKLLLSIELSEPITHKINKITINRYINKLVNDNAISELESWNLNLDKINSYEYEIRGNEIMIRKGPSWSNCNVFIEIELLVNENIVTLVSNSVCIENIC